MVLCYLQSNPNETFVQSNHVIIFRLIQNNYLKAGVTMTSLETFIQFVESLTPEQADFIVEHLRLSTPSSGSGVLLDEEEVRPLLLEVV